jgi:hypothetical protein
MCIDMSIVYYYEARSIKTNPLPEGCRDSKARSILSMHIIIVNAIGIYKVKSDIIIYDRETNKEYILKVSNK